LILSTFVLIVAGVHLWWEHRYRDMRLLVMDDGFTYVENGGTRSYPWNQIEKVVFVPVMGYAPEAAFAYRLSVGEEKELVFNSTYFRSKDMVEFGRILKQKTEELPNPPPWTTWQP
jgi:hypothetical protein